jgi:hypothetical protein
MLTGTKVSTLFFTWWFNIVNRTSADFVRFLAVVTGSLLRMHADEDLNVNTVAEESLNKVIMVISSQL